ncbi:MAG: ImmA/IrrE family metallo-endopeptidase [Burkholderiales bacterium]
MEIDTFRPDWISPPGETIFDILRLRNISEIDFARRICQDVNEVRALILGNKPITHDIAEKLESVLGASSAFWERREHKYRDAIRKLEGQANNNSVREWLNDLPVAEMMKEGWIPRVRSHGEKVSACLRFFGVMDVPSWREAHADLTNRAAFRTSKALKSAPGAVAAWIRRAELESEAIECRPWDHTLFQQALNEARALTRETDPSVFLPALQRCFAKCGVAVVVLRTPPGCPASGATKFLTRDKALMLLSFRYLSDDQFWFSVFHEGGHLVLHPNRLFVEGLAVPFASEEEEANTFAANMLVPPQYRDELLNLPIDGRAVMRFARKIQIAPGIVVGQLQHLGILNRKQLNNLKRRYKWAV